MAGFYKESSPLYKREGDNGGLITENDQEYNRDVRTANKKINNAIRSGSDEISQGANLAGESRKGKQLHTTTGDKSSIAEMNPEFAGANGYYDPAKVINNMNSGKTADMRTNVLTVSPLPNKKQVAEAKRKEENEAKEAFAKSHDTQLGMIQEKISNYENLIAGYKEDIAASEDEDEKRDLKKQIKTLQGEIEKLKTSRQNVNANYRANTHKEELINPNDVESVDTDGVSVPVKTKEDNVSSVSKSTPSERSLATNVTEHKVEGLKPETYKVYKTNVPQSSFDKHMADFTKKTGFGVGTKEYVEEAAKFEVRPDGTVQDKNGNWVTPQQTKTVVDANRETHRQDLADKTKDFAEAREKRDTIREKNKKAGAKERTKARDLALQDAQDYDEDNDWTPGSEYYAYDPLVASLMKSTDRTAILKKDIEKSLKSEISAINKKYDKLMAKAKEGGHTEWDTANWDETNQPVTEDTVIKDLKKQRNDEIKQLIEDAYTKAGGYEEDEWGQPNKKKKATVRGTGLDNEQIALIHEKIKNGDKFWTNRVRQIKKMPKRGIGEIRFLNELKRLDKADQRVADDAAATEEAVNARLAYNAARKVVTADNNEAAAEAAAAESSASRGERKAVTDDTPIDGGWYITKVSGGGKGEGTAATYATRLETDESGNKQWVTYSTTKDKNKASGISVDEDRDPVHFEDYSDGTDAMGYPKNNWESAKKGIDFFAVSTLDALKGGFKRKTAEIKNETDKFNFDALDGTNYYIHTIESPMKTKRYLDLIRRLGGDIDEDGVIYTTSIANFPKDKARLPDFKTEEELEERRKLAIEKAFNFKEGDRNVTVRPDGTKVKTLPSMNESLVQAKDGRKFKINWNNPTNKKVRKDYEDRGLTIQDIPLAELVTTNLSGSIRTAVMTDEEYEKRQQRKQELTDIKRAKQGQYKQKNFDPKKVNFDPNIFETNPFDISRKMI